MRKLTFFPVSYNASGFEKSTSNKILSEIETVDRSASFTQWEGYFSLLRNTPLVICRKSSVDTNDPNWQNYKHWSIMEKSSHVTNIVFENVDKLKVQLMPIYKRQLSICWGFRTADFIRSSMEQIELFDREAAQAKLNACWNQAESPQRPVLL